MSWYQKGKANLDFTEDSEWQWHQLGVRKGGSTILTVRVRYIIKAPLVLMGLSN